MSTATSSETSARSLRTHRREIRDASRELARSTRATLDDFTLAWRLQLERSPYFSLGAVFAAGYVLGGGVPLRLVRFALGTGARMAATVVLREALTGSLDLSSLLKVSEREGARRGSRSRERGRSGEPSREGEGSRDGSADPDADSGEPARKRSGGAGGSAVRN